MIRIIYYLYYYVCVPENPGCHCEVDISYITRRIYQFRWHLSLRKKNHNKFGACLLGTHNIYYRKYTKIWPSCLYWRDDVKYDIYIYDEHVCAVSVVVKRISRGMA